MNISHGNAHIANYLIVVGSSVISKSGLLKKTKDSIVTENKNKEINENK